MGGGLLELQAIGTQDQYFIGNPDITFFKVVIIQMKLFHNVSSRFESMIVDHTVCDFVVVTYFLFDSSWVNHT